MRHHYIINPQKLEELWKSMLSPVFRINEDGVLVWGAVPEEPHFEIPTGRLGLLPSIF